jgi:hypothetical protein
LTVDVDAKLKKRSPVVSGMLGYLDVVLVVIALAPALALGAPRIGFSLGVGGWLLQRVVAKADRHWTRKVSAPVKRLGVDLFEAFGRIWLLAGVIVLADVAGGRRNGLTAALVIFGAYSVAFVIRVISGPPSRTPRSAQR